MNLFKLSDTLTSLGTGRVELFDAHSITRYHSYTRDIAQLSRNNKCLSFAIAI